MIQLITITSNKFIKVDKRERSTIIHSISCNCASLLYTVLYFDLGPEKPTEICDQPQQVK